MQSPGAGESRPGVPKPSRLGGTLTQFRLRLSPHRDTGLRILLQFERVKEMGQQAVGWLVERDEVRAVLLFANAQLLDVGTTGLGLRTCVLDEGNPSAAGMLSQSGNLSLALKLLVGMMVMLIVHRFISP